MYLIIILTLTLTLTDPVTPYFIRPLVSESREEHSRVRGWGAARPRTIFATISSYVDVPDKLSGPESKSGVWVGY